jgi:hypothetical protein
MRQESERLWFIPIITPLAARVLAKGSMPVGKTPREFINKPRAARRDFQGAGFPRHFRVLRPRAAKICRSGSVNLKDRSAGKMVRGTTKRRALNGRATGAHRRSEARRAALTRWLRSLPARATCPRMTAFGASG